MTPQEVIKSFMSTLDTHTLKLSNYNPTDADKKALAKEILDQAVAASSNFNDVQELIDSFIADCRSYNAEDSTKGWNTFLKEKCGIDIALNEQYLQYGSVIVDYAALKTDDTGAITGSDANITLSGGEVIGTGVSKNKEQVVPEYGNYYEAMTDAPQSIDTGNNGWMIKATGGNDTIISGGEDSINAGAGNNFITLKGSAVTVDAASGNNSIFIDDAVKSVTLLNYDSTKTTLSGNTSVVKNSDGTTQTSSPDTAGGDIQVEEKIIHEEIAPSADLPGNPIPSTTKRGDESSSGDVAPNVSDIILNGNDNYFNLTHCEGQKIKDLMQLD